MKASAEQHHPRLISDSERPGAGVGAILRGARLARDEEIREVAAALRIRKPYLEAIEEGRIEDLPGVTYGIGFVRGYAEYLGLNSADIVSRFKLEARGINRQTQLHFPEPLPGNRVPGGALLLLVLVMAGAVYGGWLYTSSQDMTFMEAVEALPERFLTMLEEPETELASTDAAPAAPPESVGSESAPPASAIPVPGTPATEDPSSAPAATMDSTAPLGSESSSAAPEPAPSQTPEETAAQTATANTQDVSETPPAQPETTPAASPETPPTSPVQTAEPSAAPAPETQAVPDIPPTSTGDTAPQTSAEEPASPDIVDRQPASSPEAPAATEPGPVTAIDPTGGAAADTAITPPQPEPPPAPAASGTATTETPEPPAEEMPSDAPSAIVSEDLPAPAVDPADAPEPASTETQTASAPASSGTRIIIQATNESWVQVLEPNGNVLIEKLMLMGEIYKVPDREGLILNTGNAGALKLIVNGTLIPPLSTDTNSMRGIELSPQALLP